MHSMAWSSQASKGRVLLYCNELARSPALGVREVVRVLLVEFLTQPQSAEAKQLRAEVHRCEPVPLLAHQQTNVVKPRTPLPMPTP